MKPNVWLRSASRFSAGWLSMRSPWRKMLPLSGWSRVPSRCSSVLLPEADAPTTLRNSPGGPSSSAPLWTGTSILSLRYALWTPTALSSGTVSSMRDLSLNASLLVPQRPHWVQHRRPQRRQHAEQHRDADSADVHQQHAQRLDVRRDFIEVVRVAAEDFLPGRPRDEVLDLVDVRGDGQPQAGAAQGADGAQQQAVGEEDFHHAAVGGAQRLEDADVARLLDDYHREDGE